MRKVLAPLLLATAPLVQDLELLAPSGRARPYPIEGTDQTFLLDSNRAWLRTENELVACFDVRPSGIPGDVWTFARFSEDKRRALLGSSLGAWCHLDLESGDRLRHGVLRQRPNSSIERLWFTDEDLEIIVRKVEDLVVAQRTRDSVVLWEETDVLAVAQTDEGLLLARKDGLYLRLFEGASNRLLEGYYWKLFPMGNGRVVVGDSRETRVFDYWTRELEAEVIPGVAQELSGDKVLVYSDRRYRLHDLSEQTQLWEEDGEGLTWIDQASAIAIQRISRQWRGVDLESGEEQWTLPLRGSRGVALVEFRDGGALLRTSDKCWSVMDTKTGTIQRLGPRPVSAAGRYPSGEVWSWDALGTLTTIDGATGETIARRQVGDSAGRALSYGQQLATLRGGQGTLWLGAGLDAVGLFETGGTRMKFAPGGEWLWVWGREEIHQYHTSDGRLSSIRTQGLGVADLASSTDGRVLVAKTRQGVRAWRDGTAIPLAIPIQQHWDSLAVSADGSRIALGGTALFLIDTNDGSSKLIHGRVGRFLHPPPSIQPVFHGDLLLGLARSSSQVFGWKAHSGELIWECATDRTSGPVERSRITLMDRELWISASSHAPLRLSKTGTVVPTPFDLVSGMFFPDAEGGAVARRENRWVSYAPNGRVLWSRVDLDSHRAVVLRDGRLHSAEVDWWEVFVKKEGALLRGDVYMESLTH